MDKEGSWVVLSPELETRNRLAAWPGARTWQVSEWEKDFAPHSKPLRIRTCRWIYLPRYRIDTGFGPHLHTLTKSDCLSKPSSRTNPQVPNLLANTENPFNKHTCSVTRVVWIPKEYIKCGWVSLWEPFKSLRGGGSFRVKRAEGMEAWGDVIIGYRWRSLWLEKESFALAWLYFCELGQNLQNLLLEVFLSYSWKYS